MSQRRTPKPRPRRAPGGADASSGPRSAIDDPIARLTQENIEIVAWDPEWPALFEAERQHLLSCLPADLVLRIEHFGSTAIPDLVAKPIIDILIEVTHLDAVRERVVPVLESQGYEYFWRPFRGDDEPPFYAWFIKRDSLTGARSHHIHIAEGPDAGFEALWDGLVFRDYLRARPDIAAEYGALKLQLAHEFPNDRAAYTEGKTAFVLGVVERAKREE